MLQATVASSLVSFEIEAPNDWMIVCVFIMWGKVSGMWGKVSGMFGMCT